MDPHEADAPSTHALGLATRHENGSISLGVGLPDETPAAQCIRILDKRRVLSSIENAARGIGIGEACLLFTRNSHLMGCPLLSLDESANATWGSALRMADSCRSGQETNRARARRRRTRHRSSSGCEDTRGGCGRSWGRTASWPNERRVGPREESRLLTDHQNPSEKNGLFGQARPYSLILSIVAGRAGQGSRGGRHAPTETVGPETGTENVPM